MSCMKMHFISSTISVLEFLPKMQFGKRQENSFADEKNIKKILLISSLTVLGVLIIFPLSSLPVYAYQEIHVPRDYPTIQTAINAANASDDIVIDSGTYSEQLSIGKSLNITGSGGTTIIKAPAILVTDIFGMSNIIDITGGATVKISKLTVSGPGSTNCGSITTGIFVSGDSTLKITNSTITDIHDSPAGGCQNGVGIFVGRAKLSTTGHAEISDVTITKYQKGGIVVDNTGSTANIQDNQISWGLSPLNIASNGIQVSRGAQAIVLDNKVTGNICSATVCGPDLTNPQLDQAAGILLYGSGDRTVVKYNEVSQNDIGIGVINCGDPFCLTPPSTPSVEIKNNTISNSGAAGIVIKDENYTVSDNIVGSGPIGIAIIGDSLNTVAMLVDNKIDGATTDIWTFSTPGHNVIAMPSITSPSSLTIMTGPSSFHTATNSTTFGSIPADFPNWLKDLFKFYAQGKISYDNLIKALQYLIK